MDALFFAGMIVFLIVLFMGIEYSNSRNFQKRMLEKLYQGYGRGSDRKYGVEEMGHIGMYYQKHRTDGQIDDITWNDLHMDELYQRINTSLSAAGDEYLYYRLRTPVCDEAQMEKAEEQIRFFMEHEEERHRVQGVFYRLGRMRKFSVYEYLDHLDLLGERKSGKYFLWDLAVLVSVGAMWFSIPVGTVLLLIVLCHNLINYFKEYKEIEPYISSFQYIRRLLTGVAEMKQKEIAVFSKEQERLRECYRKLKGFLRSSYLVISSETGTGNPLEVILDYLRMLFYFDLIQFNRALLAVRGHMDEIDEMITLLGRMETVVVAGEYRTSLGEGCCVPKLHYEESPEISLRVEELYHPFLENPVKNSLSVSRGVLLTGSNASGKSTFLRAVATAVLLSQTIHTCPASYYEAPFFRLFSSMSLRDDLSGGDSYYMVEIKSIKRILDQVKRSGPPVLCFVDEVLRGTNTVERIAASTQIMKMLAAEGTLCFAATHDVELTRLLEKEYHNYHFEERIEENDISFPYKLLAGPAVSRNAIALLKMLGYEENMIAEAEAMAERFLESGQWE